MHIYRRETFCIYKLFSFTIVRLLAYIVNCFTAWNMYKVKPKLFSRIIEGRLNWENICCHYSRWNILTMTLNWFRMFHRNVFLNAIICAYCCERDCKSIGSEVVR